MPGRRLDLGSPARYFVDVRTPLWRQPRGHRPSWGSTFPPTDATGGGRGTLSFRPARERRGGGSAATGG